jgi:hypothetical protein
MVKMRGNGGGSGQGKGARGGGRKARVESSGREEWGLHWKMKDVDMTIPAQAGEEDEMEDFSDMEEDEMEDFSDMEGV